MYLKKRRASGSSCTVKPTAPAVRRAMSKYTAGTAVEKAIPTTVATLTPTVPKASVVISAVPGSESWAKPREMLGKRTTAKALRQVPPFPATSLTHAPDAICAANTMQTNATLPSTARSSAKRDEGPSANGASRNLD